MVGARPRRYRVVMAVPRASLPLPATLARLRREEGGFTLIELVFTASLSLVVFGAAMTLVVAGLHKERAVDTRVAQLNQVRVAQQFLVRDLRQATTAVVTNSQSITYTPATGGGSVTYTCAGTGICTRTQAGVTREQVRGITNTDIFAGTPSNAVPQRLSIKFVLSSDASTSCTGYAAGGKKLGCVTLQDAATLRNLTLSQ